jgi:SAM-dependent methyltransferase
MLRQFGETEVSKILVLGSGGGADISAIRKLLGSRPLIVGIDINIQASSYENLSNTLLIQTDITKYPIFGGDFDIAYSFATFEHIRDIKSAWQAMINVLKVGGMLYTLASPL